MVYDLGTHLIDQVVILFGMPERITAFVGAQREGRPATDEDSCTVLLHYQGMMATVKAAVVSPETRQLRFWVRGDGGSFKKVIDNPCNPAQLEQTADTLQFDLDVQEDQLKAGKGPGELDFGVEAEDRRGTYPSGPSSGP